MNKQHSYLPFTLRPTPSLQPLLFSLGLLQLLSAQKYPHLASINNNNNTATNSTSLTPPPPTTTPTTTNINDNNTPTTEYNNRLSSSALTNNECKCLSVCKSVRICLMYLCVKYSCLNVCLCYCKNLMVCVCVSNMSVRMSVMSMLVKENCNTFLLFVENDTACERP